jgi:hypothetical protein
MYSAIIKSQISNLKLKIPGRVEVQDLGFRIWDLGLDPWSFRLDPSFRYQQAVLYRMLDFIAVNAFFPPDINECRLKTWLFHSNRDQVKIVDNMLFT